MDIDMVFEDAVHGRALLVELDSETPRWDDMKKGKRLPYEGLVRIGRGRTFAACYRHAIPLPGVEIDTRHDILEYQAMWLRADGTIGYGKVHDGKSWPVIVRRFYDGPLK
jgi:hypothetical protein